MAQRGTLRRRRIRMAKRGATQVEQAQRGAARAGARVGRPGNVDSFVGWARVGLRQPLVAQRSSGVANEGTWVSGKLRWDC